jgi:hypothetical protein
MVCKSATSNLFAATGPLNTETSKDGDAWCKIIVVPTNSSTGQEPA